MSVPRVFIVEQHHGLCWAIRRWIEQEAEFEVVGTASSAAETLPKLAVVQPDALVVDVRLGSEQVLGLLRLARAARPELACLALLDDQPWISAQAVVKAGADACVTKDEPEALLPALRRVLAERSGGAGGGEVPRVLLMHKLLVV